MESPPLVVGPKGTRLTIGLALTPGCQIGYVDHTALTPGCQFGYVDHTGCHHTILAVINWCLRPYALLGLSLPGVTRLVTWTILPVINWCFDQTLPAQQRGLGESRGIPVRRGGLLSVVARKLTHLKAKL
jgi:hypothetical protein